MRRLLLCAAVLLAIAAIPSVAGASSSCGSVSGKAGRATNIRASGVTCGGAKTVLKTWLAINKFPPPHTGWRCTHHGTAYNCRQSALGVTDRLSFRLKRR